MLQVGIVTTLSAPSEFQPQLIHDRTRDLRPGWQKHPLPEFTIEAVGPEWNIIGHSDQLSVDIGSLLPERRTEPFQQRSLAPEARRPPHVCCSACL